MAARAVAGLLLCLVSAAAAAGSPPAARAHNPAPDRTLLPEPARAALGTRLARLSGDGSAELRQARLAGRAAPETLRAVALMCDFADSLLYGRYGLVPGVFPPPRQSDFYYAAHDSVFFAHQMADVQAYFRAASNGRFTFACDIVGAVANLSQPMSWYGDHPQEGEQPVLLARDVVAILDAQVDFSRYDTVIILHAGAGEETDILDNSPEQIYSTYLSPEDFEAAARDTIIAQPYLPTDDFDEASDPVRIEHVLILPETEFQDPFGAFAGYFGSLGVYCFEVGLRLGMLSLSDFTPSGSPDSQGVGEFDLMGYGLFVGAGFIPCQPSAFNKLLMGWIEPYRVEPGAMGTYRLDPSGPSPGDSLAARVEIGGQEYWLLEYRLQDPDGNGIFTFAGDLNGNNVPDFYDADSALGNGVPTGFFDPATDQREWLAGAEWDFFMSENSARPPGIKGAGSGVYIWHVDEGVIRDVIGAETNLFNADPARKSVDLEEADGIQDLDSRQPSPFFLGGDFDSFRAENSAEFGPATVPDTRSAGGAWTGVVMDRFSNVVVDSAVTVGDPPRTVIEYAGHMSFRCMRQERVSAGPAPLAERHLAGVDLRGSHLLVADLDASPDGRLEIVATGTHGQVMAFEPDLQEHHDGDGDPLTIGVLALGTDEVGGPVRWNGPPAVGFLAGASGGPQVVLTTAHGVYAFQGADGEPAWSAGGSGAGHGLLVELAGCSLPPVLLPVSPTDAYAPDAEVVVAVLEEREGRTRLRLVDGEGADWSAPLDLGAVVGTSAPSSVGSDWLAIATRDTVSSTSELVLVDWRAVAGAEVRARLALTVSAGPWPVVAVFAEGLEGAVVADGLGAAETVWWHPGTGAPARRDAWPTNTRVGSPLSATLACAGGGLVTSVTALGAPLTGWPTRPRPALVDFTAGESAWVPSPVVAQSGDERATLFQARDGRLYLYDGRGRLRAGWPVSGPAAAAGTPVLADLDGDGSLEAVASGTFDRLRGRDADTGELVGEPMARLAVIGGVGPGDGSSADWPMWQGSPWRTVPARAPGQGGGTGSPLVEGSLLAYPSPLVQGPLHVRALFDAPCAVNVYLHTLEGEQVANSGPVRVLAPGPHEVVLDVPSLAGGLYLCRLVVGDDRAAKTTSVVPVAVAR